MAIASAARPAMRAAPKAQAFSTGVRYSSTKTIQQTMEAFIPERQELAKKLRTQYADAKLGDIKVENVMGGMRGLKAMVWDPSQLDSEEGIRFWGRSIPECQEVLPTAKDGEEMLPEAMFWYLLTSKVPSQAEIDAFQSELAERSELPEHITKIVDAFPKTLHPMTQFMMSIAALNHDSKFASGYKQGMPKTEYWKPALEDSLDCVAKSFTIAARIYRNVYLDGAKGLAPLDKSRDLSWNFCNQIGFGDKPGFIDVIRLYNALHTDHEGGNVSAHTTHLVGSALSDPFLSYSAALGGLAGPLHGLANQEVLRFILGMNDKIGGSASDEQIKDHIWATLKSGQVIPGYGHAVLRKPDPRFMALRNFALKREDTANDPIVKLVNKLYEIAPGVLTEHGKTKNPYPNVDAASGCLLYHYGLTQFDFYTVTFGTSRAMGGLAQLVWDRALGLPLERPKSLSMDTIAKMVGA